MKDIINYDDFVISKIIGCEFVKNDNSNDFIKLILDVVFTNYKTKKEYIGVLYVGTNNIEINCPNNRNIKFDNNGIYVTYGEKK